MSALFPYAGNNTVQAIIAQVKALLNGKVDKVEGMGLSHVDVTEAMKTGWDAAEANVLETLKIGDTVIEADTAKQANLTAALASYIAALDHLTFSKVDTLPTSDISTSTIYLLANGETEGQNVYTEYMYLDSKWEIIGTTYVNMDDYVLKTDMEEISAATVAGWFTSVEAAS